MFVQSGLWACKKWGRCAVLKSTCSSTRRWGTGKLRAGPPQSPLPRPARARIGRIVRDTQRALLAGLNTPQTCVPVCMRSAGARCAESRAYRATAEKRHSGPA